MDRTSKKINRIILILLLISLCTPFTLVKANIFKRSYQYMGAWSKQKKLIVTNIVVTAGILSYGFLQWDYGKTKLHFTNEGWFGENTDNAGMDKLAHYYTSYLGVRVFSSLYQRWGYEPHKANLYGAMTSMLMMTAMEVGDTFSNHGFSYQDIIANTAGVLSGYLFARYPALPNLFDIRVEYIPTGDSDFATDYDGMKFLLALKLSGFIHNNRNPLHYIDLQGGYYARKRPRDFVRRHDRNLYIAVGINIGQIFDALKHPRIGTIFHYYQVPYTYIPAEHRF